MTKISNTIWSAIRCFSSHWQMCDC